MKKIMKKITCEVCGSHNIIKTNDIYVCQQCGAQYSLDELRKLLQTSTFDSSEAYVESSTSTTAKPIQKVSTRTLIIILLCVCIPILLFLVWKVVFTSSKQPQPLVNTVVKEVTKPVEMVVEEDVYVPTKKELWKDFQKYFETYYGEERATQSIDKAAVYLTYGCEIMTDPQSRYKWLGDYIKSVAKKQGYNLTNNPYEKGMEALWRWHIHSFFNCNQHLEWPKTADFSKAGQREAWADAYRKAH